MSVETTLARADAALADTRWRAHCRDCPQCVTAHRARKPDQMCVAGAGLRRAHRDADAELERQRELDLRPIPGQQALFGPEVA